MRISLVLSLRTGKVISLKNETLTNIKYNEYTKVNDELLDKLIKLKIIVPYDEIELNSILNQFKSNQESDVLNFIITPSANCQLGCSYCGQSHSKINMSSNTIMNLLNHLKYKLSLKKIQRTICNMVWGRTIDRY